MYTCDVSACAGKFRPCGKCFFECSDLSGLFVNVFDCILVEHIILY